MDINLIKELNELVQKLNHLKVKRIFIQIPEGLKNKVNELKVFFEEKSFEVVFSLEPTYGACDIREVEARRIGCEAIVHIAHSDIGLKTSLPTFYIHYIFEVDENLVFKLLDRNKNIFTYNSYVIVSSLQYVKFVKYIKEFLENLNKKVYIKKCLDYDGQILGCNLNAAKIDDAEAVIIVSEGFFYPLGLLIEVDKPVLYIDLEKKEVKNITGLREKYKKIIAWNFTKFKESRRVGLLVSWKTGQIFYDVFNVKKEIEKLGKEVFIFAFDEISPEKLEGIDVDFLINLACPRIFPDDLERYKIPMLNYSTILKHFYDKEKGSRDNSF